MGHGGVHGELAGMVVACWVRKIGLLLLLRLQVHGTQLALWPRLATRLCSCCGLRGGHGSKGLCAGGLAGTNRRRGQEEGRVRLWYGISIMIHGQVVEQGWGGMVLRRPGT